MYIPDRFLQTVSVHLIKNILDVEDWHAPLLLGINGPPGEGKTFMCESTLEHLGVRPFLISGGQLESADAGQPAALLREMYLAAGRAILQNDAPMAAVLINDFDTGVGNWGKLVQFTVNTQQLFAELMHLADYPKIVENKPTLRIPIIITGNNFASLHQPLLRTGRMWLFEWKPTPQERIGIVREIFPMLLAKEVDLLVLDHFPNQPVSFFAHVKSTLLDEYVWTLVQKYGISHVIPSIRRAGPMKISTLPPLLGDIVSAGRKLCEESKLDNFIASAMGARDGDIH